MFQNLMTGPYSAAANQDAAYIQAVYRPHPQYGSDHDQSIRSSPSWNSASANVVQQTSNESNHAFPSNHSASPFSARFPFQSPVSGPVSSASCSISASSSPTNMPQSCSRGGPDSAYFRNAAINGLHPYSYEAAAAAAAPCAWAGRLDPSARVGRLDAATAGFQAGLAASQAAFRRSGNV
jgi:hypothetical protein